MHGRVRGVGEQFFNLTHHGVHHLAANGGRLLVGVEHLRPIDVCAFQLGVDGAAHGGVRSVLDLGQFLLHRVIGGGDLVEAQFIAADNTHHLVDVGHLVAGVLGDEALSLHHFAQHAGESTLYRLVELGQRAFAVTGASRHLEEISHQRFATLVHAGTEPGLREQFFDQFFGVDVVGLESFDRGQDCLAAFRRRGLPRQTTEQGNLALHLLNWHVKVLPHLLAHGIVVLPRHAAEETFRSQTAEHIENVQRAPGFLGHLVDVEIGVGLEVLKRVGVRGDDAGELGRLISHLVEQQLLRTSLFEVCQDVGLLSNHASARCTHFGRDAGVEAETIKGCTATLDRTISGNALTDDRARLGQRLFLRAFLLQRDVGRGGVGLADGGGFLLVKLLAFAISGFGFAANVDGRRNGTILVNLTQNRTRWQRLAVERGFEISQLFLDQVSGHARAEDVLHSAKRVDGIGDPLLQHALELLPAGFSGEVLTLQLGELAAQFVEVKTGVVCIFEVPDQS